MTIGPFPHRSVSIAERLHGCGDCGPGMLHQALLADAEALGAPVGAAHLFGADRRQRGSIRPAVAQPAQVELEERGVVGGQSARSRSRSVAGLVFMAGKA